MIFNFLRNIPLLIRKLWREILLNYNGKKETTKISNSIAVPRA